MGLNMERKETVKSSRIEKARYIVIDTELTGLNGRKDSIVSIGAVKMTGGRILMNESYYRLLKPRTDLSADSIVIHEITPGEVALQPGIEHVITEFVDFCGGDIIVGYCTAIDMEFIEREKKRLLGSGIENACVDIRSLFEWARGKEILRGNTCGAIPEQYRLYDIARCFGIPFNGTHNALKDAFVTAQIFQRIIPMLVVSGICTTGDLLALSHRFEGGERYDAIRRISNF